MKTLNEVCEIVGLTRRMIQEYEYYGLAKTPTTKNKYGHLLYSEEDIDKLLLLRFYKELGYKKSEIKAIYANSDFDKQKSLEMQIELLEKKKKKLEDLINIAKSMNTIGTNVFPEQIKTLQKDMSFDVILPIMGAASGIFVSKNNVTEINDDVLNENDAILLFENIEQIMNLAQKDVSYEDIEVQKLIKNLYDIMKPILSPSIIIFENVCMFLSPGSSFARDLDEIFGKDRSTYLFNALQVFILEHQDNSFDKEMLMYLKKIMKFGLQKYTAGAEEVQEEVKAIHENIKQITMLNENGQINLLSSISEIFGTNEYKEFIDRGKEHGVSWFISKAIQIYVENIKGECNNE